LFLGASLVAGITTNALLDGLLIWQRIGWVGCTIIIGFVVFWLFGRTDDDDAVIERVKTRFKR
jgi:hypothetical protein